MRIGDTFESYAEFEKALNNFKTSNFVDYCTKDCNTIMRNSLDNIIIKTNAYLKCLLLL